MRWLALVVLLLSFGLVACGLNAQEVFVDTGEEIEQAAFSHEVPRPILMELPEPEPEPEPDPIFPNEVGEIMILMYHGLHEYNPGPYDRLTSDFWKDLQALYDKGYRLISMEDLVNNNITTPAGYTPVVLSFDDGRASAFSLKELEDGTLTPVPGTAVYILNAFYEQNPDFGRTAIFFVNQHPEPFRGAGTIEERFAYLLDNGFELGNHGYTHANLSRLNAQSLRREIGLMDQFIKRYAPGYEPFVLAYAFGIRPRAALRHYALEGEYDGVSWHHKWALRVGNTGAPAIPHHINFDPTNVSRVVASDQSTDYYAVADMWFLLRRFEDFPHLRFISDGDPNTITVPRHLLHYVNLYSLYDKELVVYDIYEPYYDYDVYEGYDYSEEYQREFEGQLQENQYRENQYQENQYQENQYQENQSEYQEYQNGPDNYGPDHYGSDSYRSDNYGPETTLDVAG